MASVAYQPDRTQAPYHGGWTRIGRDGSLQVDSFFVDEADLLLLERGADVADIAPPHPVELHSQCDKDAFKAQYEQWLDESLFDSLPDDMRAHDSFRAMVALGDRVVPLIASELRRSPSFLFLALEEITGEDPVPANAEGDLEATVAAWLSWLRK